MFSLKLALLDRKYLAIFSPIISRAYDIFLENIREDLEVIQHASNTNQHQHRRSNKQQQHTASTYGLWNGGRRQLESARIITPCILILHQLSNHHLRLSRVTPCTHCELVSWAVLQFHCHLRRRLPFIFIAIGHKRQP